MQFALSLLLRLSLLVVSGVCAIGQKLGLASPRLALGVTCDTLDTLNCCFAVAKNQFTLPIYNWIWRTNPWVSIIPRSMFDYSDGLIPEVNTSTSELPTSYPDNLPNVTLSNGTGNGA